MTEKTDRLAELEGPKQRHDLTKTRLGVVRRAHADGIVTDDHLREAEVAHGKAIADHTSHVEHHGADRLPRMIDEAAQAVIDERGH